MNPAKTESETSNKYVRYVAEQRKGCCKKCLLYNGWIYEANDPKKPVLPRHVNCRCHYEDYHDDSAKNKTQIVSEIAQYAIVEAAWPTALVMLDAKIATEIATNFGFWVAIAKSGSGLSRRT